MTKETLDKRGENEEWDIILVPETNFFSFPWRDVWQYRDLLYMFVKRDVVTLYKQTILGPIWFFIQPIMTTLVYMVVFGGIARISTDGIPSILFYSAGVIIWNYFSETLNLTSKTFIENTNLFGKVYFPRIILPISKIVSGLLKFLIQFTFFIIVLLFFIFKGASVTPNWFIVFSPVLVLLMACMGLGFGIIFTSLTTKYRDLNFLIQFGIHWKTFLISILTY